MLNGSLFDVGVTAGARGNVASTLHLYDDEGNVSSVSTPAGADVADETASDNPDVLVCADVNAVWILEVFLNSSQTLAGRLGFSAGFAPLGTDTPLFPGMKHHMENWHFVDKCTRGKRNLIKTARPVEHASGINIKKYSMIVRTGETKTIEISGLPDGYSAADLSFSSENSEVAVVDEKGRVTAASPGSAVIVISTYDGEYEIRCSVLVPQAGSK
jgi:hypothetical protein